MEPKPERGTREPRAEDKDFLKLRLRVRGHCFAPEDGWRRDLKHLLEIKELSRVLNVPVSFIYDRTRKNSPDPIPHIKIGKYVRFDTEAVSAWLAERSR